MVTYLQFSQGLPVDVTKFPNTTGWKITGKFNELFCETVRSAGHNEISAGQYVDGQATLFLVKTDFAFAWLLTEYRKHLQK
jgi:hypothetical protein